MRIQWIVDLPDPNDLEGEWVEVGVFDRRKDAIDFVVNTIGFSKSIAKHFISRIELPI